MYPRSTLFHVRGQYIVDKGDWKTCCNCSLCWRYVTRCTGFHCFVNILWYICNLGYVFLTLSIISFFTDFSHQCTWSDHSHGYTSHGFRWHNNDINGTRGSCWRCTCRSDSIYLSKNEDIYTRHPLKYDSVKYNKIF